MTGIYLIADKIIEISTSYSYFHKTVEACRISMRPQISIIITKAEIDAARSKIGKEPGGMSYTSQELPGPFVESLLVRERIAEKLLNFNCLLINGASAAVDRRGFVFISRNGSLSLEFIKRWSDYFGKRCERISVEQFIIRAAGRIIKVYDTPWENETSHSGPFPVRVIGLCILNRSEADRVEEYNPTDAVYLLSQKCFHPYTYTACEKTNSLIQTVVDNIHLYSVQISSINDAVKILKQKMREDHLLL